jgi:pimeloyl-ACP methyl ester carboxylesterase
MLNKLKTKVVASNIMMSLSLMPSLTMAPAAQAKDIIADGQVLERTLADGSKARYFLYVPPSVSSHPPLFVTVHGISRNAREHARLFAPFADQYGVVVLAPLFPAQAYDDYQRLGRKGDAEHAGRVLEAMVDEVGRLTGAKTERFFLFGYSGGGQFAHRYAMAHPERVGAYAVGAAGWYTFPDLHLPYPHGIKPSKSRPDMRMVPKRFLAIPATVLVGERDTRLDTALRKTSKVIGQQGTSRLERGRRWVAAMQQAARDRGLEGSFDFVALSRCGHSFRNCMQVGNMGGAVFERLFGSQASINHLQADNSSENKI